MTARDCTTRLGLDWCWVGSTCAPCWVGMASMESTAKDQSTCRCLARVHALRVCSESKCVRCDCMSRVCACVSVSAVVHGVNGRTRVLCLQ
jgi:hypothetical protein